MAALSPADIEAKLLQAVHAQGSIADSDEFGKSIGITDHNVVVGVIKSLEAYEMILPEVCAISCKNIFTSFLSFSFSPIPSSLYPISQDIQHSRWKVTEEARAYLGVGSPEAQVFNAVGTSGVPMADLKTKLGVAGDVGFRQAMQIKWVAIDKSSGEPLVVRKVDSIVDTVLPVLEDLASGSDGSNYDIKEMQALSKRKLVTLDKWKTFKITKGPKFALERKKPATDLTSEMLLKGTWKDADFKEYNFNALGIKPSGGYLHPLLKVRTQFRKIFTNMGFQEMPTNNYVESSFWNFDALFQPQQHPARDAHDTFFLTSKLLL